MNLAEMLDDMEKKYLSPAHILVVKSDDSGPLYILKGGRGDYDKVNSMHNDLHKLIRELRKCVT